MEKLLTSWIYGNRGGRVAKKLTDLIQQGRDAYENHG